MPPDASVYYHWYKIDFFLNLEEHIKRFSAIVNVHVKRGSKVFVYILKFHITIDIVKIIVYLFIFHWSLQYIVHNSSKNQLHFYLISKVMSICQCFIFSYMKRPRGWQLVIHSTLWPCFPIYVPYFIYFFKSVVIMWLFMSSYLNHSLCIYLSLVCL